MSLSEIESVVKSCIVSRKGKTNVDDLQEEYAELIGGEIPYASFGYATLAEFLDSLTGVCVIYGSDGELYVEARSDKASHIASLVNRQKSKSKTKIRRKTASSYKPAQYFKYSQKLKQKYKALDNTYTRKHRAWYPQSNFSRPHPKARNNFRSSKQRNTQFPYNSAYDFGIPKSDTPPKFTIDPDVDLSYGMEPFQMRVPFPVHVEETVNRMEYKPRPCDWNGGPQLHGYAFVGDDFLLQFIHECLHAECVWIGRNRLASGMCVSGQTIQQFHDRMYEMGYVYSNLVLMLGNSELLNGCTYQQLEHDMLHLVRDLMLYVDSLVILTLPLLADKGNENIVLQQYNTFLLTLPSMYNVSVLDTHNLFLYNGYMNDRYYEKYMRNIIFFPDGAVLWNISGRRCLYTALYQELPLYYVPKRPENNFFRNFFSEDYFPETSSYKNYCNEQYYFRNDYDESRYADDIYENYC